MNRNDIFNHAFSSHVFLNLFLKKSDDILRGLWSNTPKDKRDKLFRLPHVPQHPDDYMDIGIGKIPATDRVANARDVAQFYQFRMAEDFMQDLPSFFRRVMLLADDDDMLDTLFFGTLGVLSICLPEVHGSLFKEDVRTNLYIFLTGAAASGKGKIGLCRRLLDPINDDNPYAKLVIPANTSDTALYEGLYLNDGRGILFESEADTLTQAFKKGSGKFSDGLRCAFHNEPINYQRRTGNEKVYIPHPELSVVLTGTPGQMPLLFNSPENGLFSRFLFYRLVSEKESFAEDVSDSNAISGEMVNDYMLSLGNELLRFYHRLRDSHGICFKLSDEQHKSFMSHFYSDTKIYKEIAERAYCSQEAVDHIDSIMKRLGNICFRIMMILTVSRLIDRDSDDPIPAELVCNQDDFLTVLSLSDKFVHHTFIHYDDLMVAIGAVPEIDDDAPTRDDMLSDRQRLFFEALPDTFIKQKALQIAAELSIAERSVERYIKYFCELGIVFREKKGLFSKRTDLNPHA